MKQDAQAETALRTEEITYRARRASGGLVVRSGVRAGSRVKTADKQQAEMTAYLKG